MMVKQFFLLCQLILALGVFGSCGQHLQRNLYQVGASAVNITPPMGSFIAGDARNRRFTDVHDSLYVKALVVSDGANQVALLTFDNIGMLYPDLLKIRAAVATHIPLASLNPEHMVMASTHTHSGPDVVGIWGPDPLTSGQDTLYMQHLVTSAVQALAQALQQMKPAQASYAISTHGEDWVFNISDSLSIDRTLTVLQFKDTSGKSIATLTNFACHPTILDAKFSSVSADYVGGLYRQLDETFGGVNLFLQGAIGGWVQPEYEQKEFAAAERRGRELGEQVTAILKNDRPLDGVMVRFKSKSISLPVSNPGFQQLGQAGVIQRAITDRVSTEIAWFSIGEAQFATHPGETTPVHAHETKALMRTQGPKVVIGLGMDALGYILSPNFFDPARPLPHTEYMLSMSIDKDAGPVLMKMVQEIAQDELLKKE